MWHIDQKGAREFAGGKEDWQGAARVAARCPTFRADVEEEQIADEARSCYNCRYRRWSTVSFTCCTPGRQLHDFAFNSNSDGNAASVRAIDTTMSYDTMYGN